MNSTTRADSYGSIREILKVALPLIATTASHTIMTFTDRMFLAWYSPDAIAASLPGAVLSFTFICCFMSIGSYTSTLIAQFFGAQLYDNLARSLWQGIYFSLVAAVCIIAMIPLGRLIICNSGHGHIIAIELAYFEILTCGGGLVVLTSVLPSFYSGRGKTRTVMYVSFIGVIFNIILDYILIFGKLGIPAMGIIGAGYATLASRFCVVVIFACLIFCGREHRVFPVRILWKFDSKIFSKLVRFGTPNGLQFFLEVSGFSVFIFLVGSYGHDKLAANNIAFSVDMLAFLPMVGIGIATSVLVGQYIGKGMKHVTRKVVVNSLFVAASYGLFIGSLFYFVPEIFINCFQNDTTSFQEIRREAVVIFKVLPFFLIGDCIGIIYGSALGGTGDTHFKMMVTVIACLLYIPGLFIILGHWQLPVHIGWWWTSLYVAIQGIIYFLRFRHGSWEKIDMIS